MSRKARRIKRPPPPPEQPAHHPLYFALVANQHATQTQQSWFDILPHDIQEVIWREYYKNCLLQIQEFGQYRAIIRIYLERLFKNKYYNDIKFMRNSNHDMIVRWKGNYNESPSWFRPSFGESLHKELVPLFCSFDDTYSVKTYYKIFHDRIGLIIPALYGICKAVPADWDYIGRAGEMAASRFTNDRVVQVK